MRTLIPEPEDIIDVPPLVLLGVNVIPLVGVLWFGWDVGALLMLYWAENLIIGAYTVVKMIAASPVGGLFGSAFFVVHFGGFCAVHGLFILALTDSAMPNDIMEFENPWPCFLIFVQLFVAVIRHVFSTGEWWWYLAFAALALSHGASLISNYFMRAERKRAEINSLMTQPYGRVVLLHVTILAGAFAVMALGSSVWLLVILVILKTLVDLGFHLREHEKAPAEPATAPSSG